MIIQQKFSLIINSYEEYTKIYTESAKNEQCWKALQVYTLIVKLMLGNCHLWPCLHGRTHFYENRVLISCYSLNSINCYLEKPNKTVMYNRMDSRVCWYHRKWERRWGFQNCNDLWEYRHNPYLSGRCQKSPNRILLLI